MNCLSDIQSKWPRDGILRVEIVNNASSDYSIQQSYEKEYSNTINDLFSIENNAKLVEQQKKQNLTNIMNKLTCRNLDFRDTFLSLISDYSHSNQTSHFVYCNLTSFILKNDLSKSRFKIFSSSKNINRIINNEPTLKIFKDALLEFEMISKICKLYYYFLIEFYFIYFI